MSIKSGVGPPDAQDCAVAIRDSAIAWLGERGVTASLQGSLYAEEIIGSHHRRFSIVYRRRRSAARLRIPAGVQPVRVTGKPKIASRRNLILAVKVRGLSLSVGCNGAEVMRVTWIEGAEAELNIVYFRGGAWEQDLLCLLGAPTRRHP